MENGRAVKKPDGQEKGTRPRDLVPSSLLRSGRRYGSMTLVSVIVRNGPPGATDVAVNNMASPLHLDRRGRARRGIEQRAVRTFREGDVRTRSRCDRVRARAVLGQPAGNDQAIRRVVRHDAVTDDLEQHERMRGLCGLDVIDRVARVDDRLEVAEVQVVEIRIEGETLGADARDDGRAKGLRVPDQLA